MKEIVEFRVLEEFAHLLFAPDEGRRAGFVRIVKIPVTDPRYAEVGRLQREIRSKYGRLFFYGWKIRRISSKSEIEKAEIFSLQVKRFFEPAGEECGTQYDVHDDQNGGEYKEKQIGLLHLPKSTIPKTVDIAETIGGEIVVSSKFCNLLSDQQFKRLRLEKIINKNRNKIISQDWMQLFVDNASASICAPSIFGDAPFEETAANDQKFDAIILGLNSLSAVYVDKDTAPMDDIFSSTQYYGVKRGLLRPRRFIFVRPNFMKWVQKEGLRGFGFEIAHMK